MKKYPVSIAAASLAVLTLAACQSGPPVAPPPTAIPAPQPSPVVQPPLAGTAGPLTQAGIGRYMDALEGDLRQLLRGRGIVVARRGDEMLLTFPNARLFDNADLNASGRDLLASVAVVLRHYDHAQTQVNGYTDTAGSPEQNITVSQMRADLVAAALTGDGVAAARIEAHGFGETNLKIATGDHVLEPRNRRIELRIQARPG